MDTNYSDVNLRYYPHHSTLCPSAREPSGRSGLKVQAPNRHHENSDCPSQHEQALRTLRLAPLHSPEGCESCPAQMPLEGTAVGNRRSTRKLVARDWGSVVTISPIDFGGSDL